MRKYEESAFKQLLGQVIQCLRKLVGDGTNAHPQHHRRFGLCVLLQRNPAQHLPVERAQAVQAPLYIEDKNHRILKCAHRSA